MSDGNRAKGAWLVAVLMGAGLAAAAAWGHHEPGAEPLAGGMSHERETAGIEPFQDIFFAACPCWLTARELVEEIARIHSDISFECDVASGISAVEIKALSSGVGGPFRSFIHTAQARAVGDSRCRHVQTKPELEITASAGLRNPSEREACSRIVTQAANDLQCRGHELLK